MQSNRLGCLTGTGIFSALITLIVLVGVSFASGGHMFSAGDLNAQPGEIMGNVNSHAQITECKACHTAPWESAYMADRCVACHVDITNQMFDVSRLHGVINQKNGVLVCADCHPEHRGSSAALTELGGNIFPHETLGFSLRKHQFMATREEFVCSDCHGESVTTFASDSCQNCHMDMDISFTQAHILSFGTDCLACHDGIDRYGDDFSHNQFGFRLTGKHSGVSCTKCHLDARSVADLQSAPQDCFSCHQKDDPHAGAYGSECGACHSSDGWLPAKFDHNLSSFKLEGEHTEVACESCHQNNVFKGTPQDCYSCHQKDDEHNGQNGIDCAVCHNPSSWEDASFDHSNFPLTGGHASVDCKQCHTTGSFAAIPADCLSCHAEPMEHAGQFGTDCATCHSTTAWSPATFNENHVFPLNHGESGTVSCKTCHPSSYTTYTCYGCHEHNESNIRSEHNEEGISNFQNCVECHADGREHEGGGDD